MEKSDNRKRDIITFVVPFCGILAIYLLNIRVPSWVYIEHFIIMFYNITPDWLTNILELIFEYIGIYAYMIYVYIRNIFFVYENKKNRRK